ncbi:hypothetical protein SteCoe_11309 [Stentor coeruleus]|uniref:Uncharacterized protein n=1 Tax=Stentor coeruleus TaxID=5963 RepID=A0A1R2CDM2_9CILI|nr:hypothetical protein SteCoe_11309 [Stentor coeruleus]
MKIIDIFEWKNYLIYFGPPYQSFCTCYNLKRGAHIIAYIDIAAGLINLIAWFYYMMNILQQIDILSSLANYLLCIPGILALIFAFSAIRSLKHENYIPFYLYSKYKILMFVLFTLMNFVLFFVKITSVDWVDIFVIITYISYEFLTSKCIWSTAKWLKNAEEATKLSRSDGVNDILKQNLNPGSFNDIGNSVELI